MTAPIPRYQAVKKHVMEQIAAGQLCPGDRVPSENELTRQFDVSRMTANRALRELMSEGFIVRQAGLGTFVAEGRVRGQAISVTSIAREVESRGELWSADVLAARQIRASATLATEFGLPEGAPLYHLTILHRGNGVPIELEDRAVNPLVAPELLEQDFTQTTTTDYLLGVAPLLRADHTVKAVLPSSGEAALLDIEARDACLVIERKSWTGQRVASVVRLMYPGCRYELTSRFEGN